MGVAGSGKSTVGVALAARLGFEYGEADDFHPAANVAKMRSGAPLDDADRAPWLAAIATWIRGRAEAGTGCVVTCSALAARYRDVLRSGDPGLAFVELDAPADVIAARVAARTDHFMPVTLVRSQLAALEPLRPQEHGLVVDATEPVDRVVETVVRWLEFPPPALSAPGANA
jgi:gluconokinase